MTFQPSDKSFIDDRETPERKTIGTCKECRWWKLIYVMGDCTKTVSGWRGTMASGNNENSEWEGGVLTGPDFGCWHWEEKE